MDEEPANIGVSTLADPEQGRFASGGVLSRNQTEPGGEIPRFPELSGIANRGNQRRRAKDLRRSQTEAEAFARRLALAIAPVCTRPRANSIFGNSAVDPSGIP